MFKEGWNRVIGIFLGLFEDRTHYGHTDRVLQALQPQSKERTANFKIKILIRKKTWMPRGKQGRCTDGIGQTRAEDGLVNCVMCPQKLIT